MTTQRFTTQIQKSGTKTLIEIPFNPNEVWGGKQRHYVSGTVNGCAVRALLITEGEQYLMTLGDAWMRDNPIEVGATVDVILSAEGPQSELLAADLAAALTADPQAKAFFDGLATYYRKNYLRWIDSAKQPETRAARIEKTVQLLKAGKKQKET
jgi:hypothetical protein